MRCRYCNKAISLLRRLTDAEFCSDAHRRSHAEEQELAMQRLTESPPALQRTQRMAAAAAPRGIMPAKGEYLPAGPWETDCRAPLPHVEPLATQTGPMFAPREHVFRQSFHRHAVLRPVEYYRAAPCAVAGTKEDYGPVSLVRIVVPRTATASPSRGHRWSGVALGGLGVLTLPALAGGRTVADAGSEWNLPGDGTGRTEWKMTERRRARQERRLLPCRRMVMLKVGEATGPPAGVTAAAPTDFGWHPRICFPVSRLQTVAPPVPEEVTAVGESNDIWACAEAAPLAGLIAATTPSIPGWLAPVGEAARLNSAADGAGLLEFAQATESGGASEQRLPVRDTSIDALSLEAPGRVLALEAIEPVPGLRRRPPKAAWKAASLPPTFPGSVLSWGETRVPHAGIVPIAAPPAIAPARDSQTGMDWVPVVIDAQVPSIRARAAGAEAALGGAVACALTLEAAARKSVPAATGALLAAGFSGEFPALGRPAPGSRLVLCERVAVQWQPSAAKAARQSQGGETFLSISRVRAPRRMPETASGFGNAGLVPLIRPANAPSAWKPTAALAELYPPAALPSGLKPRRQGGLRQFPARLFAIPGCGPGMDEWGSKPLVCPSGLRPSSSSRCRSAGRPASTPGLKARVEQWATGNAIREVFHKASRLPSDLKWIAIVFPLVIGIWTITRPSDREPARPVQAASHTLERRAAPPGEEPATQTASLRSPEPKPEPIAPPEVEKVASPAVLTPAAQPGVWGAVTSRIAGRASVDLVEDFRNGLSNWDGQGGWARTWSYDRAGTIRPGTLSFFLPSAKLRDYVFELKASIERRAIQWVVRASGPDNYHFARLNVTPGTPLTALELERWSIVNGRAGKVTRLPLPQGGANQTVYMIRVIAHGDSITTYLQDQVVDTFNDPRLPEGGVGLAGAPEDRPRVYGIHVYHQNDFLGKLCSFLAPQPINSQGSD